MNSDGSTANPVKKTPAALPAGCLTLFGLPFAAAGIFVLVKGIRESSKGFSRETMFPLMMGLLFASVGLGIMVFSLFLRRAMRKISDLRQSHPDSPWLWREDWANSTIRSNQRNTALFMSIFAVLWNGIAWTVAVAFFLQRSGQPKGVLLLVLLFPAIGVALAAGAVISVLVWRRFGAATFRIASLPARPGRAVHGYVDLPSRLPQSVPVQLRLSCVRRERQRSGNKTQTIEHLLWQDEKFIRGPFPEMGSEQTTLPVFFRVPEDQPPCESNVIGSGICWKLEAIAALPGPNLKIDFDIPIFVTGGTAEPPPREDPTARYQIPATDLRESIQSKIIVRDSGDGKELIFPALRNPGNAFFGTLFFLGWTTAAVFMTKLHAPIVFSILFLLLDVLIGVFWFDMTFRRSRLTANRQRLISRQRWLFFQRVKEWPAASIRNVSCKTGMTSGQHRYYDLVASLDNGKTAKLASAIPTKIEADWAVRFAGRSPRSTPGVSFP